MKKLSIGLAILLAMAMSAFAQPYVVQLNSFLSDWTPLTSAYNGTPVAVGNLVQIIRVGANGVGTIDPANATAGHYGELTGDDIFNSSFAMGEGTTPDAGQFSYGATGFPSATGNPANSLVYNTNFYLRVWADVAATATTPFPAGSHYSDIGPIVVPSAGAPDVFNLVAGTWVTCGSAVVLAPVITLSASSFNFGDAYLGANVTRTLTIGNTGNAALTISNVASSNGAFTFSAVPGSIAAGGSADVTLTYTAGSLGVVNGNFTFDHNATTTVTSPASISLTGNGRAIPAPVINVSATSHDFGSLTVGTTSTFDVTISNTGNAMLNISNVATTGAYSNSTVPATIAAGGSATVTLTFAPVAVGAANGTFSFTHNAATTVASPVSISLTGNGTAVPAPVIAVDPSALVLFGSANVGDHADQNVTISNNGNASLALSNFATTGDFHIHMAASATVAAGGNTTATLRFTPTAGGTRNGTFTFTYYGGTYTVNLEGTGVVPNPYTGGQTGNNPNAGANPNPWTPTFPGDPNTGGLPPAGFNFAGGTGNQPISLTMSYSPTAPVGYPTNFGSFVINPTQMFGRFWDIQQTGGTGFNATVDLYFTSNELPAGVTDPTTGTFYAWAYNTTTSSWTLYFPTITLFQAGSPNVYRARIFSVNGFSIWSLSSQNVTPVTGMVFSAAAGDNNVKLNWHVETETGVSFYRIDRRIAGSNGEWAQVAMVDGHENSVTALNYSFTDRTVINGRSYEYRIADVSIDGSVAYHNSIVSATPVVSVVVINDYALSQNYPNPFNPETRIDFAMKEAGNVKLTVTNVMGQTVATLVNGKLTAGAHTATWNAANMPSGIYFLKMEAGQYNSMRKMVLSK